MFICGVRLVARFLEELDKIGGHTWDILMSHLWGGVGIRVRGVLQFS